MTPTDAEQAEIADQLLHPDEDASPVRKLSLADIMNHPYVFPLVGHFHAIATGKGPGIFDDATAEERVEIQREFVAKAGRRLVETMEMIDAAKRNPHIVLHPSRSFDADAGNLALQLAVLGALAYVNEMCRAQRAEMGLSF